MKCDQDLCLNFWYDFKKLLWQDELNPRVRSAFGNVYIFIGNYPVRDAESNITHQVYFYCASWMCVVKTKEGAFPGIRIFNQL